MQIKFLEQNNKVPIKNGKKPSRNKLSAEKSVTFKCLHAFGAKGVLLVCKVRLAKKNKNDKVLSENRNTIKDMIS